MLVLDQVSLKYRRRAVVNSCSIRINPGELVILVGANGAGKTTLLKGMTGLLPPSSGHLTVDGAPISQTNGGVFPSLGPDSLPTGMTAARLLRLIHRNYPGRYQKSLEMLEKFGVDSRLRSMRIGRLSTGTRQKVSLVAALSSGAPYLALDEPLNGLDPTSINTFAEMLASVRASSGVVISTHLLREFDAYDARYLTLKDGAVLDGLDPSYAPADGMISARVSYSADELRGKVGSREGMEIGQTFTVRASHAHFFEIISRGAAATEVDFEKDHG